MRGRLFVGSGMPEYLRVLFCAIIKVPSFGSYPYYFYCAAKFSCVFPKYLKQIRKRVIAEPSGTLRWALFKFFLYYSISHLAGAYTHSF